MKIQITAMPERRKRADILILGAFEKEAAEKQLKSIEPAFAGAVRMAREAGRFEGRAGQSLGTYSADAGEAS